MRRLATLALIATLAVGSSARGQQTPATQRRDAAAIAEVREASRLLDAALARGDTEALRRYYADAYVHIDQFGRRSGKEQRLAEFARGARRVQSIGPMADQSFAVVNDVVVASALTAGQQTLNGQPLPAPPRMSTRVWVRRAGHWQVLLAQTTPIVSPQAAPTHPDSPAGGC
jgi:ketosteroid isomerase-like protein